MIEKTKLSKIQDGAGHADDNDDDFFKKAIHLAKDGWESNGGVSDDDERN